MNPSKHSTHGSPRESLKIQEHPATLKEPKPSRGTTQRRDFACAGYDDCLDHACGFGTGFQWMRGFDCGGCPSSVKLQTVPVGAQKRQWLTKDTGRRRAEKGTSNECESNDT